MMAQIKILKIFLNSIGLLNFFVRAFCGGAEGSDLGISIFHASSQACARGSAKVPGWFSSIFFYP
ncbi:MAG: hypothetical protein C5B49_16035 [Bdellovibrio sp.]|nr:MAG: hypothetical protein C5B49_16035 [Bdellovibrio sp.]